MKTIERFTKKTQEDFFNMCEKISEANNCVSVFKVFRTLHHAFCEGEIKIYRLTTKKDMRGKYEGIIEGNLLFIGIEKYYKIPGE